MSAEPQKEHQWLEKLVGEWTYEFEASAGPGQPSVKLKGAQSARSLGGVWVVCEGRDEMPGGGTATTIMSLGYDPAKKRFIGTFIGTMMSHLWIYDGELDATGKVLTLDTEGPSYTTEGKMAKYKDVITLESDDHRVLTSSYQGDDGAWHQFMTLHYHRAK